VDAAQIARTLAEIATLLGLSEGGRFKADAYARGAQVVSGLGDELGPLVSAGRLTDIEGIGASLSKQIAELYGTGRSSLLDKLRAEFPPGTAELATLPGMTLRRIRALHEGLAITSLPELRAACEAGRVRALSGFGVKTEQKLLAAVLEREQREAQPAAPIEMLLSEAVVAADRLEAHLVGSGAASAVWLAGAARRGAEVVPTLELVVVGEREQALRAVRTSGSLLDLDGDEARGRLRDGGRIAFHFSEARSKGATLLHATGPDEHVEALAARAQSRGLTLTPEGLAAAQQVEGDDEAALYRRLGLPHIPPELRSAELSPDETYEDLITLQDVVGMVHCHTTYSDGRASIEDMARAADALGMQYITITDHSPSAHYAGGVTLDRLKQQWDEIAAVQERVRVRILRGTESDILADGSLDYPDSVLAQMDVVIASIHSRLKMDRAQMTERLVRAMQQPVFKIWGHALGRLLLKRDPIDCDVERVLDVLAASRGAVEINGDPHRLDLPPSWLPSARARGIPFVLSVDAHSTNGMGVLPLAVTMARRAAIRRGEVLNTRDVQAFAAAVRPVQ
jgi:DNA polymerase (family X)